MILLAIDRPFVTDKLPDLFKPGPLPDPADDAMYYVHQLADITIEYIGALHQISWWETLFAGIGLFVTAMFLYVAIVGTWSNWRNRRRHDQLARDLVNRAWSELSPADLLEAEQRWPGQFALAVYLNERSPHGSHARAQQAQASAQAALDGWFEQQRDAAVEESIRRDAIEQRWAEEVRT